MDLYRRLWRMSSVPFVFFLGFVLIFGTRVQAWSKEGHIMTCQIAQDLLEPEAAHAVRMLLPDYVDGNLSALCVWPDQIRHWYKYRWTSSLHFIDTPDETCNFDYINNMTEALLFLSHFMGDIHQVWDREIILTAAKDFHGKDMSLLQQDIEGNFTDVRLM
ncbi:bifunctional nuclease i [Actinidia rufa]|uniref:Aspergillus nuclease S1 n=1 Tax=Actinidia rufa TaxID=165716 RepID=A0A7J0F1N9_9ERIC|nr:bifunctional nuclease i [Actinidia rufa]